MPVYRAGKNRWRVRIWWRGTRRDWIVNGTKKDAEAYEARKRVEVEHGRPIESRVVPTFFDFSTSRYKPYAKSHLKPSTWSVRRYQLASLVEFFGAMKLTDISAAPVEAYKQRRLEAGLKPISVNNELAVLQAVLSYARHLEVPTCSFAFLPLKVRERSRMIVWSEENVDTLLGACASLSPELVPIVVFLANTGARRGEALALTWDCIDRETGLLRIKPNEEWSPKNNRAREVPLSDELLRVLDGQPRDTRWVFPSRTGERFAFWPKTQFDRARKAAGLVGGPHTLRHTFASHFLKKVPDLFLLARVLGHSDARVTRLYSHLLPEHLARARNAVDFHAPEPSLKPALTATQRAARRWGVDARVVSVARNKPKAR